MTREEFLGITTYIGLAINKPLNEDALEVYFDLLGDLDAQTLQLAAKRVLLEHRWASFPTVAELREAAAETVQGRTSALSTGEAWALAWAAIGRLDPEVEGSFDRATSHLPPLVLEAMKTFGVAALCYGDEPIGVIRAQFSKVFEQLAAREKRLALLPAAVKQVIESKRPAGVVKSLVGIGGMPE